MVDQHNMSILFCLGGLGGCFHTQPPKPVLQFNPGSPHKPFFFSAAHCGFPGSTCYDLGTNPVLVMTCAGLAFNLIFGSKLVETWRKGLRVSKSGDPTKGVCVFSWACLFCRSKGSQVCVAHRDRVKFVTEKKASPPWGPGKIPFWVLGLFFFVSIGLLVWVQLGCCFFSFHLFFNWFGFLFVFVACSCLFF